MYPSKGTEVSSTISKDEFVRRLEAMSADFSKKWQDRRGYAPNQFPSLMLECDWWEHFLRHVQVEGPATGAPAGRIPSATVQASSSAAKALSAGGC
jgi:hypothetical protein